jgi:hypothetical protein
MPIAPEHLISDASELLHRNAHPKFIHNGRISSQVFRLKTDDKGQLSVQQNSKAVATIAYARYTARGFESAGVWSVAVAECSELSLEAYDDPLLDDDSHAVLDLTRFTISQSQKLADKLAHKARARGCQYSPPAK